MHLYLLLVVLMTICAPPLMGYPETLVGSSIETVATSLTKYENGTVDINKDEENDLKNRMERIEAKDQRQEEEIKVLKTLLEEEKKFSKQLSGRISQLEASTNPSSMENDQLLARQKRPYRLLPPHISIEKENKDGGKSQQFYGPATNCDELGLLGYTLNGYYLVKKTTDSTKKWNIGIVYCQFQQLHGQKQSTTLELRTLVDLENSELEVQITDHVSHKLLPIDSKIMEQTKQIKEIFGLLGKKSGDSSLSMEPKKDEMKITSTKPSTVLVASSVSVSKFKTTNTPGNSAFSDHRKCIFSDNNVVCKNVTIKNIKKKFKRTSANNILNRVKITLLLGDEFIPENILGRHKTVHLEIYSESKWLSTRLEFEDPVPLLKVDVNAFQSTKNHTKTLKLQGFDGSRLDLSFLFEFNQLTNLELYNIHNIQNSLHTLPRLPELTELTFSKVRGLNDSNIKFPALSTRGLKELLFFNSRELTDDVFSRVLDWILLSSAKTLETLYIHDSEITTIPSQIPSFTALTDLSLANNVISTIEKGALLFSSPVSKLGLWRNNITSIEPGALQDDFSNAIVSLNENHLTRFDESVFRPMLEQMVTGSGEIEFYIYRESKIDCSAENICHLAWLIRNGKLREKVKYGQCSNGTVFSGLGENGFNHCPDTKKS